MKIKQNIRREKAPRHSPFAAEVETIGKVRTQPRNSTVKSTRRNNFVDKKESRKIFNVAKQQRNDIGIDGGEEEDNDYDDVGTGDVVGSSEMSYFKPDKSTHVGAGIIGSKPNTYMGGSDEESDDDFDNATRGVESGQYGELVDLFNDNSLGNEDLDIFNSFMPSDAPKQLSLASLILKKLELSNEASIADAAVNNLVDIEKNFQLDPRVVNAYKKVGELMGKYRSGPIPKALKLIPTLKDWEELLFLTEPDYYSPAAIYKVSKLFVMSGTPSMAQKFFNLVILPRVRDDIAENKKLNPHLFNTLIKAFYKPAVFFKGFLLPLLSSGTCTLREAVIIGGVVSKASIPVLHSSAVILRLASMEYTGATSLMLRIMIDKKYALPYTVVDALALHFVNTSTSSTAKKRREAQGLANANFSNQLPLLWHHCLLAFATRYKQDMTLRQKQSLLAIIKIQKHQLLTPEIKRELKEPISRPDTMLFNSNALINQDDEHM